MSVLIFDFDGTIADSMDLAIEIFYEVTGHPRVEDPARIAYLRTLPLLKVAKEARVAPHQIPRLLLRGRSLMHQRIDEVKTFPHLHDTLQQLHEAGYQLFVMSSNSQQNVEHFLQKHALADYFDGVYGGVGLFSKTGALRKIVRRNKLQASDCYYIGDEMRDMNAARKAHIQPIAVAWGYNDVHALRGQNPFAVAEKPSDLLRIFQSRDKHSGTRA
jgi:HAD superfamily hydrolase (TIGR01549 family)